MLIASTNAIIFYLLARTRRQVVSVTSTDRIVKKILAECIRMEFSESVNMPEQQIKFAEICESELLEANEVIYLSGWGYCLSGNSVEKIGVCLDELLSLMPECYRSILVEVATNHEHGDFNDSTEVALFQSDRIRAIVKLAEERCQHCAEGTPVSWIGEICFHGTWLTEVGEYEYDIPCHAQEEQRQLAELSAE